MDEEQKVKLKKRFKRLLQENNRAQKELAFKGAQMPEDYAGIEARAKSIDNRLRAFVRDLIDNS